MQGFKRLHDHQLERKVMLKVIEQNKEALLKQEMGIHRRFLDYWLIKKRRIVYLMLGGLVYYYDLYAKITGWWASKKERMAKKYRKRWAFKYNPIFAQQLAYKETIESFSLPQNCKKLSPETVEKATSLLYNSDQTLKYGLCRELVAQAMQTDLMKY